MAVVKYDVTDVETGGGGEQPEPAMYDGNIVSITHRKKKTGGSGDAISDFEVVVDIGEGYSRLWYYVRLPDDPNYSQDRNGWKLREFTDALGLPPKGGIDAAKIAKEKPAVKVKVVADTDNDGNYRGKIKNMYAPGEGAKAGSTTTDASVEEPWTEEDLTALTDDELKAEVEAFQLTEVKTAGRAWRTKAITAILEAQESEPEPETTAEEDEAAAGGNAALLDGLSEEIVAEISTDPDHYAEWSDEDIAGFINDDLEMGEQIKTAGRGWRAKAIAGLVEFAEAALGSNGDAPDAAPEAIEDDYDDAETWPDSDLKAEIAERNEGGAGIKITGRATRAKMIEALREDNLNAVPF